MEGDIETTTSSSTLMTLDEPVSVTIKRDLNSIWDKLKHVIMPKTSAEDTLKSLKDWDLWGPMFLCLALAIILSLNAKFGQVSLIFTFVFILVWAGAVVVTINGQLLVCVLGYCLFPLVIVALLCTFFRSFHLLKFIFVVAGYFWANKASSLFISQMINAERKVLAVYPVYLFYLAISLIIFLN
ncbi:hypothetical protein WA158_000005 [Blastocystis sp. Blastoise]